MKQVDVPGIGIVTVTVSKIEFAQAGYELMSLDRAVGPDGRALNGDSFNVVEEFLKARGIINS